MENTDSVTTSLRLNPFNLTRSARRLRSRWGYTMTGDRESRQPSMMLAWLSSSEMIRSFSPITDDSIPTLAWYPLPKRSAAGVPFH